MRFRTQFTNFAENAAAPANGNGELCVQSAVSPSGRVVPSCEWCVWTYLLCIMFWSAPATRCQEVPCVPVGCSGRQLAIGERSEIDKLKVGSFVGVIDVAGERCKNWHSQRHGGQGRPAAASMMRHARLHHELSAARFRNSAITSGFVIVRHRGSTILRAGRASVAEKPPGIRGGDALAEPRNAQKRERKKIPSRVGQRPARGSGHGLTTTPRCSLIIEVPVCK